MSHIEKILHFSHIIKIVMKVNQKIFKKVKLSKILRVLLCFFIEYQEFQFPYLPH